MTTEERRPTQEDAQPKRVLSVWIWGSDKLASPTGFENQPDERESTEQPFACLAGEPETTGNDALAHPWPTFWAQGSQSRQLTPKEPAADPVESALSVALELAAKAGQFDVVATLARELSERRRAREAPDVTSLDAERAKREREGKP